MEILSVDNLSFKYPGSEKYSLSNISFKIDKGQFILICGQSGCGKSTLLRHLKRELSPNGQKSGRIYYKGKDIYDYDDRTMVQSIGYVLQNPDSQIVTEKVYHELSFGLESLGLDSNVIRRRVAEMASFFGIQKWFRKSVNELSGGQKQLLNLASVMVMQPDILILDEPTAQLDPIATRDFINIVLRINSELSTTVIIAEHNIEEVYSLADKAIVLEDGKLLCEGSPRDIIFNLDGNKMSEALPTPCKIYRDVKRYYQCGESSPLSIKDGMMWLDKYFINNDVLDKCSNDKDTNKRHRYDEDEIPEEDIAIEMRDVCFSFNRGESDIIRNLTLSIRRGEIYSILGGNGTGKTTSLCIMSRLYKYQRGKVLINGRNIKKFTNKELYNGNIAYMVQNPRCMFVHDNLRDDLEEASKSTSINEEDRKRELQSLINTMGLSELLDVHPYDLSGGEIQKAALARILLLHPKIILLDEPTKGIDNYFKGEFGKMLKDLTKKGITIVMVTHDIEFCAKYSDRCALFFDGSIVSVDNTKEFFMKNSFYTTSANRMCRSFADGILTCEEAVDLCKNRMEKKRMQA